MSFTMPLAVFEKNYRSEKNSRAKQRVHALLLRRQKYTQKEISELLCVTQGTVSNICRRFENKGWQSIQDKPRSGRPARMTNTQKESLKKSMNAEIVDGDTRRGWQTKDVRIFMRDRFGVKFTDQHLRRIVHEVGMSWKVPRPEHKNRNERAVSIFKKTSRGRPSLWLPVTKSSV